MANAREDRRKETRRFQREARKIGTVHPRSLARSVSKAYCRQNSIPERECGKYFRRLFKEMPKRGKRVLNTERIIRRVKASKA